MNGSGFARGLVGGLMLAALLIATVQLPLLAQEQADVAPAQAEAMPAEPMPAEGIPAEPMPAEPMPESAMEGDAGATPEAQEPMTEMPGAAEGDVPAQAAPATGAEAPPAQEQAGTEAPPATMPMEGDGEEMMQEEALEMAPPPAPPAPPPPPVVERAPRGRDTLEIGTDFRSAAYRQVTGLIFSDAHGKRLVRTFVSPAAAAKIYRKNAAKVRQGVTSGLLPFPEGTVIVQESFDRKRNGTPGKPGPLFVMKKEARGYDSGGNDWRYAFAQPDLQLIGDGTSGPVGSCKACHMSAQARDYVMASDR